MFNDIIIEHLAKGQKLEKPPQTPLIRSSAFTLQHQEILSFLSIQLIILKLNNQIKFIMGNGTAQSKYSFQNQYDLLDKSETVFGYYRLKDKQNSLTYVGREIQSNDKDDVFQLECIINQKTTNPSPFVTKLLESHSGLEQSYCSTIQCFYLLYREPSWVLYNEMNRRSQINAPFHPQQIDNVITRVAKGLKYLYDINHKHCQVYSQAITWPEKQNESVQLIDEWALPSNLIEVKQKELRSRNQEERVIKNGQLCSDLKMLGEVAKSMQKIGNYNNLIRYRDLHKANSRLQMKIEMLAAENPLEIFHMFNSRYSESEIRSTKQSAQIKRQYCVLPDSQFPLTIVKETPYSQTSNGIGYPKSHRLASSSTSTQQLLNQLNFQTNRPGLNLNAKYQPIINKAPSFNSTNQIRVSLAQPLSSLSPSQFPMYSTNTEGQILKQNTARDSPGYPLPKTILPNSTKSEQPLPLSTSTSKRKYEDLFTSPQFYKKITENLQGTFLNQHLPLSTSESDQLVTSSLTINQNQQNQESENENGKGMERQSKPPYIIVHNQEKQQESSYLSNHQFTPQRRPQNYPISTIIEVSERSQSVKSDDDRDYVLEEYENGSRYEGYKLNGMRNGDGKFYYHEGSLYEGNWKNNNMHGFGRLYYSSGKLAYEGEWFIDQFHGFGKVYNDTPVPIVGYFDYTNFEQLDEKWKSYEGTLVSDSKQGFGKLVLSNDQFYQGQFQNDKVHGHGRFVTMNGQNIQGVWSNSRLVKVL